MTAGLSSQAWRLARASVRACFCFERPALMAMLSSGVLSSALWASPPALAQAEGAEVAQAEQLFAEGRALLDQGRYREACTKFELSSSLEPSPGTLLNLGNCYESEADLVRALSTFERAFIDAQQSPDPERRQIWSDAARERIASLGARVPQLTLRGLAPDTTVSLDGQIAKRPEGAWRVNPGHHVLEAAAPGKRTRRQEFDIGLGQHIAISIPPLEPELPVALELAPTPPPTAPGPTVSVQPSSRYSSAPASAATSGYGPWPWVFAGGSVTLLGASLVTGLAATSRSNRLERECGGRNCDPALAHVQDSAETLALATDVLWITGAIAAGVSATLFVIGADDEAADTALQASCSPLGCSLRGGF